MRRRTFLGNGAIAAAGIAMHSPISRVLAQDVRGAAASAVVATTAGPVRGVERMGVSAFYGIPYGASTAGAGRFMPPAKPAAWSGVRETVQVGNRSPQSLQGPLPELYALDRVQTMGEDCLNLNVWTPATGVGDRAVMVWLHGGGHTSGSGDWLLYDGGNLASGQDVVVVSVTHRLNVFGYLYLNELGGDAYANSGNVGTQDIIAALEWVRDNIAEFGGDPGNVTIFGQSGGGGKVSSLMAMPTAAGLFHRAIAMSGSQVRGITAQDGTDNAERFMAALGLKPTETDRLRQLPMEQLRQAFVNTNLTLGPVVDGRTLHGDPFHPSAPALSADIPFMLGSTEHEVNFIPSTPLDPIDDAELARLVGEHTHAENSEVKNLIDLYRKGRPEIDNVELYQVLASDNSFRVGVLEEAELKAAQRAPVYMYYFTWQSPVRQGKLKSYHCLDIPFVFNNVDEAASMAGAGQSRYRLADRLSGAFAAFARHGNPNHDGIPDWPVFSNGQRATMFVDNEWRVVDDPYGPERAALARLRKASMS